MVLKLKFFQALTLAGACALPALLPFSARAEVLISSDRGVSLDLPGRWTALEPESDAVVLQAENDHAEIKVRALPQALTDTEFKAKLQATQRKLKKSGVVARKIYDIPTAGGARFCFIEFDSEGRRYQSGYFTLAGRSYGLLAADLTVAEFRAIPASLAPPAAQATPAPAAPALPQPLSQPPAAAPDGDPGALAAPPSETLPETAAPAADLAPLPERKVGGSLWLLLLVVLVSAGALGYRAYAGKRREAQEESPLPASAVSFHIEKFYPAFNTVFNIRNAAGQEYRAVSPRLPTLLLGTGIVLYLLIKASVQGLMFAGVEFESVPVFILSGLSSLLSLSNLLIGLGAILFFFFRKKMKLYDASGSLLLDVCQKRFSFGSQYFMVRDASGTEGARIRRVGLVFVRRRWQLQDLEGNVLLDVREDSAGRALARKFLGHLWGLLRTNYVISAGEQEVGEIKREWAIWNRYNLRLQPPQGLDPELALATALFVDIADPDRWHPWHG
jgi:uncharacterized protein YxjI